MQKQVPQSLYFGDASLCSSFHFYSPLMDLRQTLFLFLEARQEKMESIHEDVPLRNQTIFSENNLRLDFLKNNVKDHTEMYPKAPMNFTCSKLVFISLKLQRPFFKHM